MKFVVVLYFIIDFNMLTRRWKIEKWIWYQLFLVNVDIFESEKDIPLSRLNELQQRIKDDRSVKTIKEEWEDLLLKNYIK